jgi:phospholipid/cholesterol/gamma-HCH transport system substrate-binding protein
MRRINLLQLQIGTFLLIGVLGVVYATFSVIGVNLLHRPFHVRVQLPDAGGIFAHANVDYRGQQIGTVSDVSLRPGGVTVELAIDSDRRVPTSSRAVVTSLSAVGEQYVDLRPQAAGPPYLADGDVIPESRAQTPLPVATLLVDLEAVVHSIDPHDLDVVITELSTAFAGNGQQMHQIVQSASQLVDSLRAAAPQTVDLVGAANTVLTTAVNAAGDFRTFSTALAQLTAQLKSSDSDIGALLANGQTAIAQLDSFVRQTSAPLGVLLGNLVTTGNILVARVPGLSQLLIALPVTGANLAAVARGGQAQTDIYLDTTSPVCGYLGAGEARSPLDISPRPPYVNKDCATTAPNMLQRGARYAPRPAGDTTASPPSGAAGDAQGPTLNLADPRADAGTATVYDPLTGVVGIPGGGTVRIGAQEGGSWLGLLLALLSR